MKKDLDRRRQQQQGREEGSIIERRASWMLLAAMAKPASSIKQAAGMMLMSPSPAQSSRAFFLERGSLSSWSLAVCVKGITTLMGSEKLNIPHWICFVAPSIERIVRRENGRGFFCGGYC